MGITKNKFVDWLKRPWTYVASAVLPSDSKAVNYITKNKFYVDWLKNPWTYVAGAVLLAVFQAVNFTAIGSPWGVTGTFALWGAWLYEAVGGSVDKWHYFMCPARRAALDAGFLAHGGTMRNLGIIFGALLATLLASQFKFKKIKSKKQIIAASLGGFLMGYGARIAPGCNIGALFSGISSLSLAGWVFAVFIFLGAMVGSKLLVKVFM